MQKNQIYVSLSGSVHIPEYTDLVYSVRGKTISSGPWWHKSIYDCRYCYLWSYFTYCSSLSIVDFEQVNCSWVRFCYQCWNILKKVIAALKQTFVMLFCHFLTFKYVSFLPFCHWQKRGQTGLFSLIYIQKLFEFNTLIFDASPYFKNIWAFIWKH